MRNHDELTLDQLSESERQEVFDAFGPEEDMQLYGRGLRRRLPPMLDGDQARMRLVYSLLFSLPGTPVLFYGEEIGMGENLDVPGRMSVRTPMQWTRDTRAGFTPNRRAKLPRPIPDGRFGPLAVNVAEQRRDGDSLLSWMERVIRRRRQTPELGWGRWSLLRTGDDAVLAHRCDWKGAAAIIVHNLDGAPRSVTVQLGEDSEEDCVLLDLLDSHQPEYHSDGSTIELLLGGYGHMWLKLQPRARNVAP